MVVNAPDVYKTFLDISGQTEPTLGTRKATVDAAFGGNSAAFTAVNPIDVMSKKESPDANGIFVAGTSTPTNPTPPRLRRGEGGRHDRLSAAFPRQSRLGRVASRPSEQHRLGVATDGHHQRTRNLHVELRLPR